MYNHYTSLSNFKTLGYILYNIIACMVATALLLCFCVLCYCVLCDNVFILICVCRILIKGYFLTYIPSCIVSSAALAKQTMTVDSNYDSNCSYHRQLLWLFPVYTAVWVLRFLSAVVIFLLALCISWPTPANTLSNELHIDPPPGGGGSLTPTPTYTAGQCL